MRSQETPSGTGATAAGGSTETTIRPVVLIAINTPQLMLSAPANKAGGRNAIALHHTPDRTKQHALNEKVLPSRVYNTSVYPYDRPQDDPDIQTFMRDTIKEALESCYEDAQSPTSIRFEDSDFMGSEKGAKPPEQVALIITDANLCTSNPLAFNRKGPDGAVVEAQDPEEERQVASWQFYIVEAMKLYPNACFMFITGTKSNLGIHRAQIYDACSRAGIQPDEFNKRIYFEHKTPQLGANVKEQMEASILKHFDEHLSPQSKEREGGEAEAAGHPLSPFPPPAELQQPKALTPHLYRNTSQQSQRAAGTGSALEAAEGVNTEGVQSDLWHPLNPGEAVDDKAIAQPSSQHGSDGSDSPASPSKLLATTFSSDDSNDGDSNKGCLSKLRSLFRH